ncbi:GGDEF domain-containing protein, partial [Rhizobium ruizarguesonis]
QAEFYSHLGEHAKALQCMVRYRLFHENSYVRDRPQYLYTLGQIYNNSGKFTAALSPLLEAVALLDAGGRFASYVQIY